MHIRFFKKAAAYGALSLLFMSLTGCLYPDEQTPGANQVSSREAVITAQDAVDRYQEQTGLLPIQNADAATPLYEKYKIDFGKLKRMGYIAQIPTAAFENGGSYQFIIIDEETEPAVKLLDLAAFQKINDIQKKVKDYRANNGNRNPAGEEIYPGFAVIDFAKLSIKDPNIQSMYSNQPLNLIVNEQGVVMADYGIDIQTAVNKLEEPPQANTDLRRLLVEASYYVPVHSPVYHWVDDQPQAVNAL